MSGPPVVPPSATARPPTPTAATRVSAGVRDCCQPQHRSAVVRDCYQPPTQVRCGPWLLSTPSTSPLWSVTVDNRHVWSMIVDNRHVWSMTVDNRHVWSMTVVSRSPKSTVTVHPLYCFDWKYVRMFFVLKTESQILVIALQYLNTEEKNTLISFVQFYWMLFT